MRTLRSVQSSTRDAAAAPGDLPDLIARAAGGETDALGKLFAMYADRIYQTALRLTLSPDDADDVVQDVFIGLPEALRHYVERGRFAHWLTAVAVRVALMRLRAGRMNGRRSEKSASSPPAPHDPHSGPTDRLAIADALAHLSDDDRAVVVLKLIEGYSHDEIAHELGIRPGTSAVRLHRALAHLRSILGED